MGWGKYLCLIIFGTCCSVLKAGGVDWQKIENSLYSIELPASWIPMQGMPGDGTTPGEREAKGYRLYYFAWQTPVKSKEDIPFCMGVDIQTYRKLDDTSLSVEDIEKSVVIPVSQVRNVIYSSKDELRIIAWKDSKEMDGSMVKYRMFYLLRKSGKGVHRVEISLRDAFVKDNREVEKLVGRILNSFTLKESVE